MPARSSRSPVTDPCRPAAQRARGLHRAGMAAAAAAFLALLAAGPGNAYDDREPYDDSAAHDTYEPRGYNSEYVFATTRGVNEMDAHPALKVTIIPVAIILDLVFLPFALTAGLFG